MAEVCFILLNKWQGCSKSDSKGVPTGEYPKVSQDGARWDSKERSIKCQGDQFRAFIRGTYRALQHILRWTVKERHVIPRYAYAKRVRVWSSYEDLINLAQGWNQFLSVFWAPTQIPGNVQSLGFGSALLGKHATGWVTEPTRYSVFHSEHTKWGEWETLQSTTMKRQRLEEWVKNMTQLYTVYQMLILNVTVQAG